MYSSLAVVRSYRWQFEWKEDESKSSLRSGAIAQFPRGLRRFRTISSSCSSGRRTIAIASYPRARLRCQARPVAIAASNKAE